jgi:hypothetical protein
LSQDLRRLFQSVAQESLRDQARRGRFIGNAVSELAGRCPKTAAKACGNMAAVEEALYQALLRGRKNGEIKDGLDLRAIARFLYSSLLGLQLLQLMAKATRDRKMPGDIVKVITPCPDGCLRPGAAPKIKINFLVECRLERMPFDLHIEETHHGKPTESTSVEQIYRR